MTTKALGDLGEAFVAQLLRDRGYEVREIGGNFPVIDLEVQASSPFRVSVKTSASRRHVRMGSERSVSQILDSDFVFVLMPPPGLAALDLRDEGYDLLIIPGRQIREDALYVHRTYLNEVSDSGRSRSGSAGILIKSYSRRQAQREAWARCESCKDGWAVLPPP